MAKNADDDGTPPGFFMVRRPGVMPEELRQMFRDFGEQVSKDIEQGHAETNRRLDEVNAHLRTLNGRVGGVEQDRARLDEAVKNLQASLSRRRDDPPPPPGRSGPKDRRITERDVRMVAYGVGGLTTVVGFFWKILPAMLKLLTP